MYKITNNAKDVRKFRDNFTGKFIFVEPGKFVLSKQLIKESSTFTIEKFEKKKQTIEKEVKQHDSSNN